MDVPGHHFYAFRSEHIHALRARLIGGDRDASAWMGRKAESGRRAQTQAELAGLVNLQG
jgi:hypothetical protein